MQFAKVLSSSKVAPHGATKVVLGCKVPFEFLLRRYHVFNFERRFTADIKDGSMVSFNAVAENGYPELTNIQLAELDSCFICEAYFPKTDMMTSCGECLTLDRKQRIEATLKLVSSNTKMHKFSKGVSLSFVDECDPEGGLLISTTFQNHPWFEKLEKLEVGGEYFIRAWVDKVLDDGNCFITIFEEVDNGKM